MPNTLHIVQSLVAPVILVSAIGLFCLGLYNRLAAIVCRLRACHREHFELTSQLRLQSEHDATGKCHRQRATLLEQQSSLMLRRARLLRNALMLLLGAVLSLLLCSLTLGLLEGVERFERVPIAFLTVGILMMIAGMSLAIRELFLALDPVRAESLAAFDRELDDARFVHASPSEFQEDASVL